MMAPSVFPVFVALSVLGMSLLFGYITRDIGTNRSTTVLGATTRQTYTGVMRVITPEETRTYRNVIFPAGYNAYEFMLETASKSTFNFEASTFDSVRIYVHTVNGRRILNDEFWQFRVNGEVMDESYEDYMVQNGDLVELRLAKL